MKRAGRAATVANPGQRHDILAQVTAGHRYAGHHRNQITEHRNRRNNVANLQVAKMAGAILALGRRSVFRHVLSKDVARRNALDQQRANIANHGRDPIAFFHGEAGAHRYCFLPEARIQTADNFVLPEQAHHAFFQLPVELHVVIQIEVLFAL